MPGNSVNPSTPPPEHTILCLQNGSPPLKNRNEGPGLQKSGKPPRHDKANKDGNILKKERRPTFDGDLIRNMVSQVSEASGEWET